MPVHLTHVSNADLRTKFGFTEPLAALKLTQNKLRRLQICILERHIARLDSRIDFLEGTFKCYYRDW